MPTLGARPDVRLGDLTLFFLVLHLRPRLQSFRLFPFLLQRMFQEPDMLVHRFP